MPKFIGDVRRDPVDDERSPVLRDEVSHYTGRAEEPKIPRELCSEVEKASGASIYIAVSYTHLRAHET